MASIPSEVDDLARQVQSLPAELYVQIYTELFTADGSAVRNIDKSYKPPKFLSINRASRALFAESYHGQKTAFHITNESGSSYDWLSIQWLKAFPSEHLTMLREVRSVFTVDLDAKDLLDFVRRPGNTIGRTTTENCCNHLSGTCRHKVWL